MTTANLSGPFWDGVNGREPVPPAAATVGFEYVDFDRAAATIELAFTATADFTTPTGDVLGGFLAAMVGIAPRVFLKKLVADVLDRFGQFPDFDPRRDYALTVRAGELTDVERNAASAGDLDLPM